MADLISPRVSSARQQRQLAAEARRCLLHPVVVGVAREAGGARHLEVTIDDYGFPKQVRHVRLLLQIAERAQDECLYMYYNRAE